VALFALSHRPSRLFAPVMRALEARGWRVQVFSHVPSAADPPGAISFDQASAGAPLRLIRMPRWRLDEALLSTLPMERSWVRRALSGAWAGGETLRRRQRRVLERWRPRLAITYGHEVLGLSLKAAADDVGIPTLFMPHGVMPPYPWQYYFFATATAVYGQPCIDVNRRGPWGARVRGAVPTGAPHYDELFGRLRATGGQRVSFPDLTPPPSRPYLVLFFATWGLSLISHAQQLHSLRMIAEGLPDDCFLMCKLHPSREEREAAQAILSETLPAEAFAVIGEKQHTTPELLSACHVAVSVARSMSLVDTIIAGRPAVGIVLPDLHPDSLDANHPAKEFRANGRLAHSAAELRAHLVALTRDEGARQEVLKNREAYVSLFLGADGRATERVVALIEQLAGQQQTPDEQRRERIA
jgi:hypothetical protein